ncbi:hypothetical protein BDY19DRAFT_141650 [Irpex rosettiformis]|uniref:Uncharacterized protein n=1 Tax=Irpex rosettiformis TaxID=378272 RepID=A0ACB8TLW4_9APHY|nr:hypothetical protein BDY19DRAFT_141650 [Irpex rosettiformis]
MILFISEAHMSVLTGIKEQQPGAYHRLMGKLYRNVTYVNLFYPYAPLIPFFLVARVELSLSKLMLTRSSATWILIILKISCTIPL